MKQSTEKKHPKPPVYHYTPLPNYVDIYENPNALPYGRKRLIIRGHRFHQQHELQIIPEDKEVSWKKPRLSRVELMIQNQNRQGPMAVEPAPIPSSKSTWAMVAAANKPLGSVVKAGNELEKKVPAKPVVSRATATSMKPGTSKNVSVKPAPATTMTNAKSTTAPKRPVETPPTALVSCQQKMKKSRTPARLASNMSSSATVPGNNQSRKASRRQLDPQRLSARPGISRHRQEKYRPQSDQASDKVVGQSGLLRGSSIGQEARQKI